MTRAHHYEITNVTRQGQHLLVIASCGKNHSVKLTLPIKPGEHVEQLRARVEREIHREHHCNSYVDQHGDHYANALQGHVFTAHLPVITEIEFARQTLSGIAFADRLHIVMKNEDGHTRDVDVIPHSNARFSCHLGDYTPVRVVPYDSHGVMGAAWSPEV